jgi:hypothetical protein
VDVPIVTAPATLMGPAVFLDSTRTVLSRAPSPDGRRVAQLERLVVGGTPSIVVTVRRSWMPDWYLTACKAVGHYGEAAARLRWVRPAALGVDSPASDWTEEPPFRLGGPLKAAPGCRGIVVLTPGGHTP